jgi:hypothetical protein
VIASNPGAMTFGKSRCSEFLDAVVAGVSDVNVTYIVP